MKRDNTELFETMPVKKALLSLIIPTTISQMINVLYNMADTFFIGQLGDPNQVAAATLAMPPFIMMAGFANLFGIGGSSLISRSLGLGDRKKASHSASFCIYSAICLSLIYGLAIYITRPWLLPLLGTDADTYNYCHQYMFWTITMGGIPTVLSACFAHLVRAEGYSKEASIGIAMGCILNVIFDPIFIFAFDMKIEGAAIATMLANVCSLIYFIILITKNKKTTVIKLSPKNYSISYGIPKEILLVGFPSFLMLLMGTTSNLILNKLIVSYSNAAMAGAGIGKRLDMLAFAIANGMTQGAMPLISYNFASGNHKRMDSAVKNAFIFAASVATVGALFLFICAVPVVKLFIDDAETVAYGQYFLKTICVTCPAISITMMTISIFQATGQKIKPLILSFFRKGGFDIPLMFILNSKIGVNGIPIATPTSDLLAMVVALIMFVPYWKKLKKGFSKTKI